MAIPPQPLPVTEIVLGAIRFLWTRRKEFLDLSFPAVLTLGTINTVVALNVASEGEGAVPAAPELGAVAWAAQGSFGAAIVVALSALFFWTTFGVGWLRLCLLPKESHSALKSLQLDPRHGRFAGYLLGLALASFFISATALVFVSGLAQGQGGLAPGVWLLALVVAIAISARLSQVLPAAAIDHGLRFRESWNLTQGQTARLLAIFAAVTILPSFVLSGAQGIVVSLLDGSQSFMALFVRAFTGTFLNYVGLALVLSALALVYDRLRVGRPPSVDVMVS